jgi:hypothetical protein
MATTYKTGLLLFQKKVQSETAKHLNNDAERAEPLKNGRKYFLQKAIRVEGTKKNINFVRSMEADIKLQIKMKTFFKTISLLTLIIVLGIGIFYACKKENKDEQKPPTEVLNAFFDIDELIKTTGIDIYALSKLEKIQNVSIDMNSINSMKGAKATLTDELALQITQLKNAIELAAGNEDYNTFFALFEQLCTLTKSINGIKFVLNDDGYQIIEYDDTQYYYPCDALEHNAIVATEILDAVAEEFPAFLTLPEGTQHDVLAASFFLNYLEEEGIDYPILAPMDCCTKYGLILAGKLVAYTAMYTTAAALCTGTFVAVLVCEGLAFASYIDASVGAINSYKNSTKNCGC